MAISLGVFCWVLGIGTVLSFNLWADLTLFGRTFFDSVDYLSQNIMLPLGGLLIALFAAWKIPGELILEQLGISGSYGQYALRIKAGIIAPLCVALVFINTLFPEVFEAINRAQQG